MVGPSRPAILLEFSTSRPRQESRRASSWRLSGLRGVLPLAARFSGFPGADTQPRDQPGALEHVHRVGRAYAVAVDLHAGLAAGEVRLPAPAHPGHHGAL